MFAAIDFGVTSPSFFHIAASLLQNIGDVEPALKMPAAKLAFFILLVAGSLSRLLNLDLVLGKLDRSQCARSDGCSQKVHPRSSGECREVPTGCILLEAFCAMPWMRSGKQDILPSQNSFLGAACSGPTRPATISATK